MKKFFISLLAMGMLCTSLHANETYRAYNVPGRGYVVVDEQNEIVAFGEGVSVREMSCGMRTLFSEDKLQILDETAPEVICRAVADKVIADSVGPLLGNIMFDQSAPYNRMTPLYNGSRTLTGCVATAMAQIMKYHEYPAQTMPRRVHSVDYKTSKGIKVHYDFDNITFDWSLILDHYINGGEGVKNYNDAQANEVAKLMATCGAAVEMDYGTDASGAISSDVPGALVEFFGYSLDINFEGLSDFPTNNDAYHALMDEFDAGRPVYMSGASGSGGHAFVCDGYKTYQGSPNYVYFHFNWGWSGIGNEWALLTKMEYNQTIQFIRGIKPISTDIETVEEVANHRMGIYDLLGNRVVEMLPGHVYIVDGQKVIK